jgi:hypothetical protein
MVTQHPREELGMGAAVKGENGRVKSGKQAHHDEQSQMQRMWDQGLGVAQEKVNNVQQQVYIFVLSFSCADYPLF